MRRASLVSTPPRFARRLVSVSAGTKNLYQQAGVAQTVNLHIKKHYYGSHESINPTRMVPKGPILDLTEPHGRGAFSD